MLLCAVVDDRDAVGKESECDCIFEQGDIVGVVGETRLILIFGEGTEQGGVLTVGDDEVIFIFYARERDRRVGKESVVDGVEPEDVSWLPLPWRCLGRVRTWDS